MATLETRISALEQQARPAAPLSERLKAARDRRRAMTPEQLEAEREAKDRLALAAPEPADKRGLRWQLWAAARRLARFRLGDGRAAPAKGGIG